MTYTLAQFRELADRPYVAQAILDAINEGDEALAGMMLRTALALLPAYRAADDLTATLDRLTTAPAVPASPSLPPGESRDGGRRYLPARLELTQEQVLERIVIAARLA